MRHWLALALLGVGLLPTVARAAQGPVVATPEVSASLVSATDAYLPGRPLQVALRLRLAPGWHTYWTNPGDAGEAPALALTLPAGVRAGAIAWPAPQAIPEGPLMAYGYTGDVVLPLTVLPDGHGGSLPILAHADWLVCASLCVPQSADLALTLPEGGAGAAGASGVAGAGGAAGAAMDGELAPSAEAPLFAAAAARTPRAGGDVARIAADGTLSLSGADVTPGSVRGARFFPAAGGALVDGAPQVLAVREGGLTLSLRPGPRFDAASGLDGVLALDGPGGARFLSVAASAGPGVGAAAGPGAGAGAGSGIEGGVGASVGGGTGAGAGSGIAGAAGPGAGAAPGVAAGVGSGGVSGAGTAGSLAGAASVGAAGVGSGLGAAAAGASAAGAGAVHVLLLALAGGLLLNLMPCVFPVLAMKAVGLARLSGAARGAVRAEAGSYVGGVLLAFAGLGGVMLGLRAAGGAAGWGFQFQSPVFVAGMAFVLFATGLVLSGVVAVGGALGGAGQALAGRGGHAGSFFTGLLAVLVATPCTAPFMGVAVAAAFAAPPPLAMAVFLAMGAGLAAPYAVLAAAPGLARALPRPGPWMEVLRQGLAFPMYAASAWLVWVLSEEAGPGGVLAACAGLVLLGLGAWAWRVAADGGGTGRRVGRAVAVAAVLGVVAVLVGLGRAAPVAEVAAAGSEAFSVARLDRLRASGQPVFVNMTASWCVTCLVNERLALGTPSVRDAFARNRVAYLEGDWTRQAPEITAFLRSHGRDGVPLYVFYPAHGAPSVLPQILTQAEVLRTVTGGG